jgi:hypothetical protein
MTNALERRKEIRRDGSALTDFASHESLSNFRGRTARRASSKKLDSDERASGEVMQMRGYPKDRDIEGV